MRSFLFLFDGDRSISLFLCSRRHETKWRRIERSAKRRPVCLRLSLAALLGTKLPRVSVACFVGCRGDFVTWKIVEGFESGNLDFYKRSDSRFLFPYKIQSIESNNISQNHKRPSESIEFGSNFVTGKQIGIGTFMYWHKYDIGRHYRHCTGTSTST